MGGALTPAAIAGRLVRGVRRPIKPYAPHAPGSGIVIGIDTETLQSPDPVLGQVARLYTVQIATAGHRAVVERCDDARDAWSLLTRTLRAWGHMPGDGPVVAYAYNLNFDLLWLFGRSVTARRILAGGSYFGKARIVDADGTRIGVRQLVYGRVAFAEIQHDGYRFILRDLAMWWPGGLAGLGELMGQRKLSSPRGLGRRDFLADGGAAAERFRAYARRDAVLAYQAGNIIRGALGRLGIWSFKHVPVSAAHAASLLYRRGLPGAIPPARTFPTLRASLHAYAGGRSGSLVRGIWPRPIHCYDVNSMYPWAMTQLPEPAGWISSLVQEWAGPHALYLVDGRCTDTDWPGLVERDRSGRMWPLVGEFRGVWTTGYELASFRRWGDGEATIRQGFVFTPTRKRTSFPRFVRALYPLRSDPDPAVRALAKHMLNALSGKFAEYHSRFALPHGLRFRVAAPGGLAPYAEVPSGRVVRDPNNGAEVQVTDERISGDAAHVHDTYIGTLIDALMEGDYAEIKRQSYAAGQTPGAREVNLEYVTQDAGGTFAPEVATLILGCARARLHDLMHQHRAIYWDTDSVMTETPPEAMGALLGSGIGKLKVEAAGTLHVSRAKLYYIAGADGAVERIATAGIPDRIPERTRARLVDGESISYRDVRAVTPGTSRDAQMRDVGAFLDVRVEVSPTDDPRTRWLAMGDDLEYAEPVPMPLALRSPGRNRAVRGEG